MSLSIFEHGDGRYRLVDDEREVGWLKARTLGIAMYDDDADALDGACAAYDALNGWLSRQRHADAVPRRGRVLKVRANDPERALTLGATRVGRLVGPSDVSGGHGFELELPPRLSATLVAAQVVYEAIRNQRAAKSANVDAGGNYVAIGGPL